VCGSQALEPNLWATATLTASSDNLSPTAVISGACSQSPECGEASDGALERIRFFSFAALLLLCSVEHAFSHKDEEIQAGSV